MKDINNFLKQFDNELNNKNDKNKEDLSLAVKEK